MGRKPAQPREIGATRQKFGIAIVTKSLTVVYLFTLQQQQDFRRNTVD
jgi:hypothetical protein